MTCPEPEARHPAITLARIRLLPFSGNKV